MGVNLAGIKIAVLGGDRRELELIRSLAHYSAEVWALGYPTTVDLGGGIRAANLDEALSGAKVVIAPMSNTDDEGRIKAVLDETGIRLDDSTFQRIPAGTPLFIGIARPFVRQKAAQYGIRIVETAEIDVIAILNSIPTAEGAVQIAMQQLPITIHGSHSVVVGFGRCGITLGRLLGTMGSHTTIVARNEAQLARATEMGLLTAHVSELRSACAHADVVFNTVPALLITKEVLEQMQRDCLIIDIASAPGGVDFKAAESFGIKVILASGLPGKVAPKTAGKILAQTLPHQIKRVLELE